MLKSLQHYLYPLVFRQQTHHCLAEARARSQIRWSLLQARWAGGSTNLVYNALRVSVQCGPLSTKCALEVLGDCSLKESLDTVAILARIIHEPILSRHDIFVPAAECLTRAITSLKLDSTKCANETIPADFWTMIDKLLTICSVAASHDKNAYESALRLRGALHWMARVSAPDRTNLWQREHHWARLLSSALSIQSVSCTNRIWERNTLTLTPKNLSLRLAAVHSLKHGKILLRELASDVSDSDRSVSGLRRSMIFMPFHAALNDDDEQVRNAAAEVVAFVLNRRNAENVFPRIQSYAIPIVALDQLFRWFETLGDEDEEELVAVCLEILTVTERTEQPADPSEPPATHLNIPPKLVPAQQMLDDALQQDAALFVVEKPNLYYDPVQDARRAARLLLCLRRKRPGALAHRLGEWVLEGLTALLETAQARPSGALGWTSDPDVFVLGMRLFITADMILSKGWITPSASEWAQHELLNSLRMVLASLDDPKLRLPRSWRVQVRATLNKPVF